MDKPLPEEQTVAVEISAEAPPVSKLVPRMRIAHLMLWTLCSAIYMTFWKGIRSWSNETGLLVQAMDTTGVIYGIQTGALLTGVIVLIASRIEQGSPLCREPGHWITVVEAISILLSLPLWGLVYSKGFHLGTFLALTSLVYLFQCAGYLLASRRCNTTRWKFFYRGMAVFPIFQAISDTGGIFPMPGFSFVALFESIPIVYGLALCLLLLRLVVKDNNDQQRRDWVHWIGLLSFWSSQILGIAWTVGGKLL